MKPFFIDMRSIPMQIREEVAKLIVKGYETGSELPVKHSVADLLFPASALTWEWYCYDGHNKSIPVVSPQEYLDNGGPKEESRFLYKQDGDTITLTDPPTGDEWLYRDGEWSKVHSGKKEYREYKTLEEAAKAVGKIAKCGDDIVFMITGAAIDRKPGYAELVLYAYSGTDLICTDAKKAFKKWTFVDTGNPVGIEA